MSSCWDWSARSAQNSSDCRRNRAAELIWAGAHRKYLKKSSKSVVNGHSGFGLSGETSLILRGRGDIWLRHGGMPSFEGTARCPSALPRPRSVRPAATFAMRPCWRCQRAGVAGPCHAGAGAHARGRCGFVFGNRCGEPGGASGLAAGGGDGQAGAGCADAGDAGAAGHAGGAERGAGGGQRGADAVTDGLSAGGLVVDPRVIAGTDPNLWVNASAPTQSSSGGQTIVTVQQNSQRAIMTWQQFNVGRNTLLNFDQSGGDSANGNSWVALNRIDATGSPSQILGSITAQARC